MFQTDLLNALCLLYLDGAPVCLNQKFPFAPGSESKVGEGRGLCVDRLLGDGSRG